MSATAMAIWFSRPIMGSSTRMANGEWRVASSEWAIGFCYSPFAIRYSPSPLNFHHQHMDHRLLAPDGIDGVANAALYRAGDEIGVFALAARQALESLEDRRIDQRVDRGALPRALRQTGDHHVGIAGHFALRRERERDRDDAREGELAALDDAFVACRQ